VLSLRAPCKRATSPVQLVTSDWAAVSFSRQAVCAASNASSSVGGFSAAPAPAVAPAFSAPGAGLADVAVALPPPPPGCDTVPPRRRLRRSSSVMGLPFFLFFSRAAISPRLTGASARAGAGTQASETETATAKSVRIGDLPPGGRPVPGRSYDR
jgi:hypothetical protein